MLWPFPFCVQASQHHQPRTRLISPRNVGSATHRHGGTSSADTVQVRLSKWEFSSPLRPRPRGKLWVEFETKLAAVDGYGDWNALFDVIFHPQYWGWIDCPAMLSSWDFGEYEVDLIPSRRLVGKCSSGFSARLGLSGPQIADACALFDRLRNVTHRTGG